MHLKPIWQQPPGSCVLVHCPGMEHPTELGPLQGLDAGMVYRQSGSTYNTGLAVCVDRVTSPPCCSSCGPAPTDENHSIPLRSWPWCFTGDFCLLLGPCREMVKHMRHPCARLASVFGSQFLLKLLLNVHATECVPVDAFEE